MGVFRWVEVPVRARRKKSKSEQEPAANGDSAVLLRTAEDCRNSGRLKEATTYYEKVVCFDSGIFDAWIGLVDSLVRVGEIEKADSVTEQALQLYRLARPFYALKALVLLQKGEDVESWRYSDISIEQDEAGWYPWLVRGEMLLVQNPQAIRIHNAGYCFEKSVDLAEKPWVACLWVGLIYLINKHLALAAAYLTESAHLNPLNAFTWMKLGDAFRGLRFFDQAKLYYEEALDIDPNHEPARRGLAEAAASRSPVSYLINVGSATARWKRVFALHHTRGGEA